VAGALYWAEADRTRPGFRTRADRGRRTGLGLRKLRGLALADPLVADWGRGYHSVEGAGRVGGMPEGGDGEPEEAKEGESESGPGRSRPERSASRADGIWSRTSIGVGFVDNSDV
jgi:hypothetical protein